MSEDMLKIRVRVTKEWGASGPPYPRVEITCPGVLLYSPLRSLAGETIMYGGKKYVISEIDVEDFMAWYNNEDEREFDHWLNPFDEEN